MNDLVVARRYRLGRRIGTGGMGRVWLAMDEVLRRQVAVKEVLLPESLTEDDAAELRLRTLREARTAGMVSHPNVIKVYDVIYAEDRPWIVMEYVESRSLAQVIKEDGPMAPEEAARIGLDILAALTAAHEAGVLHRDVKPGNVLLGPTRVVLTDFGLATFDDLGSSLTASGIVHGSPQFIAPERALDGTSTVAADMWSLGATLYAAVEGRAPYARSSSYATLTALATAPPDPPRHAGVLKPVLHGLLRRNPEIRMRADEVHALLTDIVDGDGDGRIPHQRHKTFPDPYASGSGSYRRRSPSGATVPPTSHSRRNRRQFGDIGRPPANGAGGQPAPAVDLPVAESVSGPPATTPSPPATGFSSAQAAPVEPDAEREHDTDSEMDLAWQLDAAAGRLGVVDAPAGEDRASRRRSRNRRRRLIWLTVIVFVLGAALGGGYAIRAHPKPGGQFTPGASGAIAWPCAFPITPAPTSTMPAATAAQAKIDRKYGRPPDGFRWYDLDGFETMVPTSWQFVKGSNVACFQQLAVGALGYEQITPTKATAVDEVKAQGAAFADRAGVSRFKVSMAAPQGLAPNDAELDFTFDEKINGQTQTMEGLVYLIRVNGSVAYVTCLITNAFNWASRSPYTNVLNLSVLNAAHG